MRWYRPVLLVPVVALALVGIARAAEPSPDAISGAKTPADHEAIAEAYESEAKELSAKASSHQEMGKRYARTPIYQKMPHANVGMETHCDKLVSSLEESAAQAKALAASHRELAKEASK